jgi:hypothetical protein
MNSKEADSFAMQILTEEDDDYSDQFTTPNKNKGHMVKPEKRNKRLPTESDESEDNMKPYKPKKDPSHVPYVTPKD